jgi:Rrf2 family iron-sulfur cluster assembly transcriptional regulator
MSIIFSRQCEYALQAVLYLARKQQGEMTSIREMTQRLQIPYFFLAKILQNLTKKGMLVSLKGPSGGFALALPSANISLFKIVEAIDGDNFTNHCVLGFSECSTTTPCAMHEDWGKARDSIVDLLTKKTIEQLSTRMHKPEYQQ